MHILLFIFHTTTNISNGIQSKLKVYLMHVISSKNESLELSIRQ